MKEAPGALLDSFKTDEIFCSEAVLPFSMLRRTGAPTG
jgi:hypothetical protein